MKARCPSHIVTKFLFVVILMALAAPRLSPPWMQAKDGTGLDNVTWSGTIRIEFQVHTNENKSYPYGYGTETAKQDMVIITEYQVEGLPHQTEMTWMSADVRVQVRGNENSTLQTVHNTPLGRDVSNSQTTHDGSGNTTGVVLLILRGQGGTDSGHCWLETGMVGSRDDGGQLSKPIPWPGTDHSWGVDNNHPFDITKDLHDELHPADMRAEIPCAKDARSLTGSKELMNSDGHVERATYDLHQDGEARTEVELVPPKEYEQWMPQADEDEKTLGNFIDVGIVAHAKGHPDKAPPVQVKKYKITLADTSRERGVDSNWPPRSRSTDDYDMKIDKDNPWITLDDDKGQSAVTKQEDLTQFMVTVNSYDWGGYTKLKVVAELEDGSSVVGHVQGHSDQDTLSIPKDDNLNHIADWWEHFFDLKNTDPNADDDETPPGDDHKGDSIALYDEYRGFHIHGKHERLSPQLKDLFIWDMNQLGAGIYGSATGVTTHLIYGTERNTEEGVRNENVVTPNGSHADVYAIYLVTGEIGEGGVGDTEGGPSVPRDIVKVTIDSNLIARGYGKMAAAELQSTIAHELGHATNVFHHGEGDYAAGDANCRQPDDTFRNYPCNIWPKDKKTQKITGPGIKGEGCWPVAVQGGAFSGDDQCLMRYDSANFYENPHGNCKWQHKGKTVFGFEYSTDPPGMKMCTSPKGTGVNDPSNPNNKAGNAMEGRGECARKFCLNNSRH